MLFFYYTGIDLEMNAVVKFIIFVLMGIWFSF